MRRSPAWITAIVAALVVIHTPALGSPEVSKARLISDLAYPATVLIYCRVDGLVDTPDYEIQASIAVIGSGFFVNPNGYIVTNGHVVFAVDNNDPLQDSVVRYYLLYNAFEALVEYFQEQGYALSEEDVQMIYDYVMRHGEVKSVTLNVWVILGEVKGADIEAKGIKARIVAKSPFIEKDIALLKIDLENTPTLLLGDSSEVKVGDEIYAIGYPGVVVFHEMLSPETMLVPSLTRGIISAFRRTISDTPALQTDAAVTHGNSGGPALNSEGEVIGVVNMGSVDPNEMIKVAGFNFLVPSNLVRDFLRENGVENKGGPVDELYLRALALYYAKCYDSAIREFKRVLELFPYHWYVKKLMADAQNALARGERARSSVNVTVPAGEVEYGSEVVVSGTVRVVHEAPLPLDYKFTGASVKIIYVKPGGEEVAHVVPLSADGTFNDAIEVREEGEWRVEVVWEGNADMEGASSTASFRVSPLPLNITFIAAAAAAVVAVIALIAILVKRRRARPPPPPIPPPPATP